MIVWIRQFGIAVVHRTWPVVKLVGQFLILLVLGSIGWGGLLFKGERR